MTVYLVGAGPGDPELITLRAARLLADADVVIYDRLVNVELLDLASSGAVRIPVGKTPRCSEGPSQNDINALLVEWGGTMQSVVRLKGGDPFVFGRGGEEALALAAARIPFEVVPGITAAVSVPASAGVPVTHRGTASAFTVVSGHDERSTAETVDWESLAALRSTIVILMGVATRREITERLMNGGLGGATPVAIVHRGTTRDQHTARCALAELPDAEVIAPSVIVIGEVAALNLVCELV